LITHEKTEHRITNFSPATSNAEDIPMMIDFLCPLIFYCGRGIFSSSFNPAVALL